MIILAFAPLPDEVELVQASTSAMIADIDRPSRAACPMKLLRVIRPCVSAVVSELISLIALLS
jgi:hypothetical protein